MGYTADKVTNQLIGLIVFITILTAMATTVLAAFTNISGSGIVLAAAVASIAGILFGIFALKGIMSHLK